MFSIQKIALKSLRRIFDNDWVFEDAVTKDDRIDLLTNADKKLLRESVAAVIRHHGEIDKFLGQFTKDIDDGLRLGVAQIILLGMPPKKVVPEIVAQAEKKEVGAVYSGILNRLDHKVMARDPKFNYPNWMTGNWRKAYGEDTTKQIMIAMLEDVQGDAPELPEADLVINAPNSETGLLALKPELIHHRQLEDIAVFVQAQNELLTDAHKSLKKGQVALYANNSLQYEECEGLVRKLDPKKWQLVEQKRILPCDSGGYGVYWAKLKTL